MSAALGEAGPRTLAQRVAIGLIVLYRHTLSALIGRECRYLPTCSDYASEAIARHGVWPGLWIGLARMARCHPLGGAGFDPPQAALPASARWYKPWRYGRWTSRHITLRPDRD